MKIAVLLGSLLLAQTLFAMPAEVLMIRHGEKPDVGNELSPKGWQRAQALPGLFRTRTDLQKYELPAALYAMAASGPGGSIRAVQTLQFVGKDLNLQIRSQFTRDQVAELVSQIENDPALEGKTVVICWEHKVLLDIARAFGVSTPPDWPGTQFDRVWKLEFSRDRRLISFENLPQNLLPGDSQQ